MCYPYATAVKQMHRKAIWVAQAYMGGIMELNAASLVSWLGLQITDKFFPFYCVWKSYMCAHVNVGKEAYTNYWIYYIK